MFDLVSLIARAGRELAKSGCHAFQSCKIQVVRKPSCQAMTRVNLGGKDISQRGHEFDCLEAIRLVFKECHNVWLKFVNDTRTHFYYVNRFTNKQMELLRRAFATWNIVENHQGSKVMLLLESISSTVSKGQVQELIQRLGHNTKTTKSGDFPTVSADIQ